MKYKERWWGITRKRWEDERVDALGDRGPWGDQGALALVSESARPGETTTVNRIDGSTTSYRRVGYGWRVIPDSDTPPTIDRNDPHRGTPRQNATNWRGEAEYYERQAAMNQREHPEQAARDRHNAAVAARVAEVKERYPDVDVMGGANFKHDVGTVEGLRERQATLRACAEVAEVADPKTAVEFHGQADAIGRDIEHLEADAALAAAADEFERAAASPAPPEPATPPKRQPNPPPTLPPPTPRPAPVPPPTTPATGPSPGATMSGSIGDAATGIRGSNDTAGEANGILQQAISQLEAARGQLQAAVAGSPQADVGEAVGMYGRAIEAVAEAQRAVQAAIASAESVAARL